MPTSHFPSKQAGVAAVLAVSTIATFLGGPAFGLTQVISASVGGGEGTPLYDANSQNWGIPGARMCDGYAFGPGVPYYDLSPLSQATSYGALTWGGNPLLQDQSTGYGLAIGLFDDGGVLTLNGALYDWMGLAASGDLFIGTVEGFTFRETGDNNNNMELFGDATVTPTGGWLFDQGYLYPEYSLGFQAVPCSQDGGDVTNFQSDIITFVSFQFDLVGIPEPCTAMLLALGGLVLRRPRRT